MKYFSIGMAVGAFVCGLIAAYYWFQASKTKIAPSWTIEPGDTTQSQMGWVVGTMVAFEKSSSLNKIASLWTALSVLFGAISSIVGAFA